MLLDDGLAKHLLIELCSRWDSDLEILVQNDGHFEAMKQNIETLMRHNGESERKKNNAMSKLTIKEILSTVYATGTEQNKKGIPSQPEVKKVESIERYRLILCSLQSKEKKKRND